MIARFARTFAEGFAVVRRPERLLAALALVAGAVARRSPAASGRWRVAFGIAMPFTGAWLMLAPLVVGVAVPTPGGVGGFHEAFRLGATAFFGADNDIGGRRGDRAARDLGRAGDASLGLLFIVQDGLKLRRHGQRRDGRIGRRSDAVKCPFCGDIGDKVVDSRESREGDVIRRRRQCLNDKCQKRFTSYERIEEIPYMVVKKDGTRERFERSKLVAGLLKACEKRPIKPADIDEIADRAEQMLQRSARARDLRPRARRAS